MLLEVAQRVGLGDDADELARRVGPEHAHAVQAHRKVRHRLQERARELRKQSRKGVADRAG